MNYKEAREYVNDTLKYGSVLGLDNMFSLLDLLGHPEEKLKFVHIAGTNGKGSVLAYLTSILRCSGYRVGNYISPSVFSYRERIQVDGEYIERKSYAAHIERIRRAAERMQAEGRSHPTAFEIETAAAFLYFEEKKCDIVVLETGLGGRLDATNVAKNVICGIITAVSMDHMAVLGDSLYKIAKEKAGIIKPGMKVVTFHQEAAVESVLKEKCAKVGAKLIFAEEILAEEEIGTEFYQEFSYKGYRNLKTQMLGRYQTDNCRLAIETAEVLTGQGFFISKEGIYNGVKKAFWPGRFEKISEKPVIIIDGAHNPAGARRLKESIEHYFRGKKIYFVMGIFADKDYEAVVEITADLAKEILTVTPAAERALPSEKLKECIRLKSSGVRVRNAGTVERACRIISEEYEEDSVVIAFGSLSYLGEFKRMILKWESER